MSKPSETDKRYETYANIFDSPETALGRGRLARSALVVRGGVQPKRRGPPARRGGAGGVLAPGG